MRADAARNSERIVAAAHAAFSARGLDVGLDEIAADAGVGIATLFRRFPCKERLIDAVLEKRFGDIVAPALARAQAEPDPLRAVVIALEAAVTIATSERVLLNAAGPTGLAERFFGTLAALIARAQSAGVIRADLTAEDTPRLIMMLTGPAVTFESGDGSWRRYLHLLLDALAPGAATPLPPAGPGHAC